MIDFYITEQSINFITPVIAANSLSFLEAQFHFSGSTWDGYSKWAHFKQGETEYALNLVNDRIEADMELDLTIGAWEVFVTGTKGNRRLTTVPVILTVMESGLVEEPLHKIPQSIAEQIDAKASTAMQKAMQVEADAQEGRFDGKSFTVMGIYESLEELRINHEEPETGDMYCVGSENPYELYIYDSVSEQWIDAGEFTAVKGERGSAGACFTPNVSESGILSWSNDGGLPNPKNVNIMGEKGDKGEKGDDGMSPFEVALAEGFMGTQDTFYWALSHIASHAAQHEKDGADMVHVASEMLEDEAVTEDKIADGAVSTDFTASVPTTGWTGDDAPYTQTVAVTGILATDAPIADIAVPDDYDAAQAAQEAWELIYRITTTDGGITLYASEIPETAFTVKLKAVRK